MSYIILMQINNGKVAIDGAFALLLLCIKVVAFKYSTQIHWALQNSGKMELKFIVSCFGLEINSLIDEILQKHLCKNSLLSNIWLILECFAI